MEKMREKLESEGFTNIYEWTDEPNTIYPEHAHKGRVAFYVIKGSILINLDSKEIVIREGERINIPVGVSHSGKVGPEGCTFLVGEEIKGDS
ncbi:MAG TPA: cupin domain-containing protein [Candidatus Paceibacterota bacterium]